MATLKQCVIMICLAILVVSTALSQNIDLIDADTGASIKEGFLVADGQSLLPDSRGVFHLPPETRMVNVRAIGYQRSFVSIAGAALNDLTIRLRPMSVRALYLTEYGIASTALRNGALGIIKRNGANALVITIKSDRGMVAYPSAVPLATLVGASKHTTIRSLPRLVADLHEQGIYLIARIVTFKDDPLARARQDLAIHTENNGLYRDREQLAWTDPFQHEVRNYNIEIAREAAQAGFDEVQFDYVRFPDCAETLRFSQTISHESRVTTITDFLRDARVALAPYNVFLSVDVFGYTLWNKNDTGIGQQLEEIAAVVDYVCPMLYPSGFQYGIPGHRNPVATGDDIYSTVKLSLDEAIRRTKKSPKHFRPWIQGFRDYGFNRRAFAAPEVALQRKAAADASASGWALWNARNDYTTCGL